MLVSFSSRGCKIVVMPGNYNALLMNVTFPVSQHNIVKGHHADKGCKVAPYGDNVFFVKQPGGQVGYQQQKTCEPHPRVRRDQRRHYSGKQVRYAAIPLLQKRKIKHIQDMMVPDSNAGVVEEKSIQKNGGSDCSNYTACRQYFSAYCIRFNHQRT